MTRRLRPAASAAALLLTAGLASALTAPELPPRETSAATPALRIAAGPVAAQEAARAGLAACAEDRALILRGDGQAVAVRVELATDPVTRAQGLMNRAHLPAGQGMLFVYETPQPASFWMKNTLIPLDMLFFDARGVLRHIHAKAQPLDLTPVPGADPGDPDPARLMVLEIGGGEAARLHLAPGDRLAHPALPQGTAAWRCR